MRKVLALTLAGLVMLGFTSCGKPEGGVGPSGDQPPGRASREERLDAEADAAAAAGTPQTEEGQAAGQ